MKNKLAISQRNLHNKLINYPKKLKKNVNVRLFMHILMKYEREP